jgi:flagellar biosynthesis protein FlhF
MQLRKFYGRTVGSALAQVKRELGPDALILETNTIAPGSPAAQMNPEARYEVLAARDPRQAAPAPLNPRSATPAQPAPRAAAPAHAAYAEPRREAPAPWAAAASAVRPAFTQPKPEAPARPAASELRQEYVDPRFEALAPGADARPVTYTRPTPRPAAAPAMPSNAIRPAAPAPTRSMPAPSTSSSSTLDIGPLTLDNPQSKGEGPVGLRDRNPQPDSPFHPSPFTIPHSPSPARRGTDLLEDLGLLRSQINQLLDGDREETRTEEFGHADIAEFHSLIDQGVDHNLLAPHFRAWLEWRTAAPSHRAWMGKLQGGPAARMQGESLREWLWLAWATQQGLDADEAALPARGPRVVALVGPTGSGKTTTLAKLASISRHKKRQNAVVLTLDTLRFGATEQWRKIGRLMGIDLVEITNAIDISNAMEKWDRYDWIGIDTPGGIHPESAPGMLYGSILAQCSNMESMIVLPATQHEAVCREQMKRYGSMGARKVLFSKMDETMHHGGIINLTMNANWKIDSFATGCRIPEDWERANRQSLWHRVLAPRAAQGGVA